MTPKEMLGKIVASLDDKKGQDIEVIEVEKLTTLSEYFVICTGTSTTHVKALADSVEKKLKEENLEPHHVEGYASANWILMDYGSVLVHVFLNEARQFYLLERLWSDAPRVSLEKKEEK